MRLRSKSLGLFKGLAIAVALVCCISACAPAVNLIEPACPAAFKCTFSGEGVEIVTGGTAKGFGIASSEPITAFSSVTVAGKETCAYNPIASGPRNGLKCATPNVVKAKTTGAIQILILPNAPQLNKPQLKASQ